MNKIKYIILPFMFMIILTNYRAAQGSDSVDQIKIVLQKLKSYEYGQPEYWKPELVEAMKQVYIQKETQKDVEKLMLDFYKSNATLDGKKAIWKEFSTIATKQSESDLFKLLKDKQLFDIVLAIINQAGLGSLQQFRDVYFDADNKTKIGIINIIGERQMDASDFLYAEINDGNEEIVMAAISALGKIGTPQACAYLNKVESKNQQLKNNLSHAKLCCADQLVKKGDQPLAKNIYEELLTPDHELMVQVGALNGLFFIEDDKFAFLKELLKKDSGKLKSHAIRLVKILPPDNHNGIELISIENLTIEEQIQLLNILANRKDRSIHPKILRYLASEDPKLRAAALEAIPFTGSKDDVKILSEMAATLTGREKMLAQKALYTLPGIEVDKKITSMISEVSGSERLELIKAVGERNIINSSNSLIEMTSDSDSKIRLETYEALGKIASTNDLDRIIDLLLASTSARDRRALEKTVFQIASRNTVPSESSEAIIQPLNVATNEENITSLLSILGNLKNNSDYLTISKYLFNNNPDIQGSAIKSLYEWPTTEPLDNLGTLLKNTDDESTHTLALRSYLNIVAINEKTGDDKKLQYLEEAYLNTSSVAEKKMVISGYGKINTIESLKSLKMMISETELINEIEAAILSVASGIWEQNEPVITELKEIKSKSKNNSFNSKIEDEIIRRSK